MPHLDSSIETCVSESRRGSETLKNHPFLKHFVARPSTEAYIEGLCNSLQSVSTSSQVKRPSAKRQLLDMVSDSSDDKDDASVCSKTSWNTEFEDDALSSMSILPVDVPERSSSSKKKSKKQKKAKKHWF